MDKTHIIYQESKLNGLNEDRIQIGCHCIFHPYCEITAEEGCKIIFGDYNIIEERVTIKACPKIDPKTGKKENVTINIGNYNHFKIGSYIENTIIKDCNVIDYRAKIINTFIESNNIIAPLCDIKDTTIKDNYIVQPKYQKMSMNVVFDQEGHKNNIKDLFEVLKDKYKNSEKKK